MTLHGPRFKKQRHDLCMNMIPLQRILGSVTIHYLPMPVNEVVSWQGSVTTAPDFAGGDEILQELAVRALDKGTTRRDRFAIGNFLENRGARLTFRSDADRIVFGGQALKKDVPDVMGLMIEILREPSFDTEEVQKERTKLVAALRRAMHNTGHRASIALAQSLYRPGHPNYAFELSKEIERLSEVGAEEVRAYYENRVATGVRNLVIGGDIVPGMVDETIQQGLSDWPEREEERHAPKDAVMSERATREIAIEERDNLDVCMGHVLALRRSDSDYLPLFAALYALGGNFSARLMRTVRDEMGLTYGIGASMRGVEPHYNGHFQVSVTLSREKLREGCDATRGVLRDFLVEGIGTEELARTQQTIAGSFKVRQSTTSAAVSTLLYSIERDLGADYLVRFPEEVLALQPEEVAEAVKKHVQPEKMHTAIAGSIPD